MKKVDSQYPSGLGMPELARQTDLLQAPGLPLHGTILTWWHEEGGDAVTFGSDAHMASLVGHGFAAAAHMAEAHGFRPGTNPYDLWGRVD